MPTQLALHDVTKSFDERLILDHVSLSVRPRERLGVVGENGAGKSTLLRLLAGHDHPDSGEVTTLADGGIGHLDQTLDLPGHATVAEAIDNALTDLRSMERRLRELEAALATTTDLDTLTHYGELITRFESRGGYEADARVDKARNALGLAGVGRERTLASLSGGERARLALACVLAAAPEVLLLDEPTNDLDTAAVTWLAEQLRAHRGTVVAVSHDRTFLERVASAIVEVDADQRTLLRYGDGYTGFVAEKRAARRRWEQSYTEWCAQIDRLTEQATTTAHAVAKGRAMTDNNKPAYDRHGARVQSSVSSRVRNAQERLRRLRAEPVPRPPDPLRFNARITGGPAHGRLAALDTVRVADRLTVGHLSISAGERLLVRGPNGAGKSTLMRVIAGEHAPDAGTVDVTGRVGYLPQEVPSARGGVSLLEAFSTGMAGTPDEHAEQLLAFGLFRPNELRVPFTALSVGQRRRLSLARVLVSDTELLLLDEPTNHLPLALIEELEEALSAYSGAIVVVSHDRTLRARFAGRELVMVSGTLHS